LYSLVGVLPHPVELSRGDEDTKRNREAILTTERAQTQTGSAASMIFNRRERDI
jgi:hypothetical protein